MIKLRNCKTNIEGLQHCNLIVTNGIVSGAFVMSCRCICVRFSACSDAYSAMQGESSAIQAGVQVIQQERVVLDALMLDKVPAESPHLQGSGRQQYGNHAAWKHALRTEWATECSCMTLGRNFEHRISHRLYVQTAPGEMRLATTMITQV